MCNTRYEVDMRSERQLKSSRQFSTILVRGKAVSNNNIGRLFLVVE